MSKKEIEDLLRKGAYGALMEEEDEGSKFCEEDIDQILQRRTHTITIESEGKGSTFAKVNVILPQKISNYLYVLSINLNTSSPDVYKCVCQRLYRKSDCLALTNVCSSVCRPVLLQQVTEQTSLWRIQTSGRNGPRRRSLTWMPSTDGCDKHTETHTRILFYRQKCTFEYYTHTFGDVSIWRRAVEISLCRHHKLRGGK